MIKFLTIIISLFFIVGCATPIAKKPYHKMTCEELDNEITLHEEKIKHEERSEGLHNLSNSLGALGGATNSYSNPYTSRVTNAKVDMARAEQAYYAQGCNKANRVK